MSVNVISNNPSQDYTHPGDHTQRFLGESYYPPLLKTTAWEATPPEALRETCSQAIPIAAFVFQVFVVIVCMKTVTITLASCK